MDLAASIDTGSLPTVICGNTCINGRMDPKYHNGY